MASSESDAAFIRLESYLQYHKRRGETPETHRRMKDLDDTPGSGGTWNVPDSAMPGFWERYKDILNARVNSHIMEAPITTAAPCLIDLDMQQYDTESTARIYTPELMEAFLAAFFNVIRDCLELPEARAYLFERSAGVQKAGRAYKSDGVHIIIPDIILSRDEWVFIHTRVVVDPRVKELLGPLHKDGAAVCFDNSTLGRNSWYLPGSGKEGVAPYKLTKMYRWTAVDGLELSTDPLPPLLEQPELLSIRRRAPKTKMTVEPPRTPAPSNGGRGAAVSGAASTSSFFSSSPSVGPADPGAVSSVPLDALRRAVMRLGDEFADRYDLWYRTGLAIHHTAHANGYPDEGLELWHAFSRRNPEKYEADPALVTTVYNAMGEPDDGRVPRTYRSVLYDLALTPANAEFVREAREALDPEQYHNVKCKFERAQFKVMHPVCFVEIWNNVLRIRNETNLRIAFRDLRCVSADPEDPSKVKRGGFLDVWLNDPAKRRYEVLDFLPPPLECPVDVYNMWGGFAAARLQPSPEGSAGMFVDHVSLLVDHDPSAHVYLLNWLAHAVQRPGELPDTLLILVGVHGSGKNALTDMLKLVVGAPLFFSTANPENDIFSRFSIARRNRLFINIDEGNMRVLGRNTDLIKDLVTSKDMVFEEKGIAAMTVSNFARIIITTNHANPKVIEWTERRDIVFHGSADRVGDREYFRELYAYMHTPANQRAIYDFLAARDLSGFDPRNRYLTESYMEVRNVHLPVHLLFIAWLVVQPAYASSWVIRMTTADLTALYNTYIDDGEAKVNARQLGMKLSGIRGIERFGGAARGFTIDRRVVRRYLLDSGVTTDGNIDLTADLELVDELPPL